MNGRNFNTYFSPLVNRSQFWKKKKKVPKISKLGIVRRNRLTNIVPDQAKLLVTTTTLRTGILMIEMTKPSKDKWYSSHSQNYLDCSKIQSVVSSCTTRCVPHCLIMRNVTTSGVEERLLSSRVRTNVQTHHLGHDIERKGAKRRG